MTKAELIQRVAAIAGTSIKDTENVLDGFRDLVQATVQGGGIINTSEADTRVMVKNGETVVIGGLIRANETMLVRGVPILKDIPLLGSFFRNSTKVTEKRELLIFVTPRILNASE